MSLNAVIIKQYREIVDRAGEARGLLAVPPEGWLRTARKALGMSGAQLARRMGTTRGLVSNIEKAEGEGAVTLRKMQQMAEAMGYEFVYGLAPKTDVQAMVQQRAGVLARQRVDVASAHMALEDQQLDRDKQAQEVRRLASELMQANPARLWDDE